MNKSTVIFKTPYTFEKKVYPSIDLGGMEDLTASDVFEATAYNRHKGGDPAQTEFSAPYLLYLAAKAAGVPIEFMEGLPIWEASQVRYAAMSFFLGDESDDTAPKSGSPGEGSERGSELAVQSAAE